MGIFAGYGKDTNAYSVYIPETNTITTSGDVHFPREDSYGDLLVDPEEQEVLDLEGSTGGVDGRAEADLERRAEADLERRANADPLLSANFDATRGEPHILGVDTNGKITDFNLWFPCAAKCMENF
jgi:hypothetical protein